MFIGKKSKHRRAFAPQKQGWSVPDAFGGNVDSLRPRRTGKIV